MIGARGGVLAVDEGVFVGAATAEAGAPAPDDRRRFPRIAPPPEASLRLQQGVPARLLDLGLGGALIESVARLVPGAVTAVTLSAGDIDLRARARVRRASITGSVLAPQGERVLLYRAGLEFDALSSADLNAVKAVLSGAERAVEVAQAGPVAVIPVIPGALAATSVSAAIQAIPPVPIQFPPGWVVTGKKSTIVAKAPNERGFVMLRALPGAPSADVCEFAQASMREAGFSAMHWRPAEINGLTACVGFYHGWLDPLGAVIAEAAHVVLHGQVYLVAGVAAWAAYEEMRHEFFAAIGSFGGQAPPEDIWVNVETAEPEPQHPDETQPGRRRHLRVAGPFDGHRVDLLETPVRIYDLAEGGCFVNSLHDSTKEGERFDLKILLPGEGWISVGAEVAYSRPGFGFAVRFAALTEHTSVRLNRALLKLQGRRESAGQ